MVDYKPAIKPFILIAPVIDKRNSEINLEWI